MNITLVNSEYPSTSGIDHGGIATYTYCMANALAQHGHTVQVLAKNGTIPDQLVPGVTFQTFDSQPLHGLLPRFEFFGNGQIIWERGYSRSLLRLLLAMYESTPIDIVEIPDYNGLASEFKGDLPFPVVVHFHMPTRLVDRSNATAITRKREQWYQFEEKALANAGWYVSPSEVLKAEMTGIAGLAPKKVSVIRHAVDTERFDSITIERARKEKRDLLFVGRLEKRKGAEIIIGSVKELLAIDPAVHVTIAGETSLGESLDYRIAIEHLLTEEERARIWFLGPVRREALPVLYRNSDVFLFPSLFENAPYALFEAMAAQLPIVACDTGGVNEIIRHDENGLLAAPGDIKGFIECTRSLLDDPARADRLARCARNEIETVYSPQSAVKQTIALYRKLAGDHAGAGSD